MKKRTKNLLLLTLCSGLIATAAVGVGVNGKPATVSASSERTQPTGLYTGTLTQAINDADLDTFKVYGASTRTESPVGLRFLTTIENSDLQLIPNTAEFGTLIIPYDMLGGAELTAETENVLVAKAKVDTGDAVVPENGLGYKITLMGDTLEDAFPERLYDTVLVARAYIKYTYTANGETVTDYAYSATTLDRSIAYVASCELTDLENAGEDVSDSSSYLNQIISQTATDATISLSSAQIEVGETTTASVLGATDGVNDFAYNLHSSNESVAIITENGEIQAVGDGTTIITATIGAKVLSVELTVGEKQPVAFTDGNILYSTQDGKIFMPDGLLNDGESIVSAIGTTDEVDYFDKGKWAALALTTDEINTNAVRTTALTVTTSDGDLYTVNALSYAGVIDELSDFPAFFNNTAVPSEYDAATYPAVAPNVYGYYIVTKNLGSLTDELALTQTEATDYQKTNGFNGVLDGQGHKLQFKLTSGGLVGMVLGNATIKNIAIKYEDGTYDSTAKTGGYGVFGYITNGAPEIRNSYIERTNNLYHQGSVFGIMARPNAKLILRNTAVHANNTSNTSGWYSNMWISSASENAFLIYARSNATGWPNVTNFTEVVTGNTLTSDLSSFDTNYWTTTDNNLSWKGLADMTVSESTQKYVEVLEENWLYSTADGEMVMPDGVLNGDTVVDAKDENGVDYYENGAWQNLALTSSEIQANETKTTSAITVETANGYYYQVDVTSYAGVIDELSDFTAFFNNTAVASEYDATTYPAVAPNVYGYYIIAKDLGSSTYDKSTNTFTYADTLAFTQTSATDYQKTNGFNGVLDGQGHTLKFKLTSGGLVGLVLGNATIKNVAVIYEDASFISQNEGGGYGAFGYITNGSPVIDNCYIERTNNVASRSSVLGIMARPNKKLTLHNTVVNAYYVPNDCTWWSNTSISTASTNSYVIHARATMATQGQVANFTKVYTDGIEHGSKEVLLSDIETVSGFNDAYWLKENGKLIWKGFDTSVVTWVDGDVTTLETVTTGHNITIPTLDNGYWALGEGQSALVDLITVNADVTYYAFYLERYLDEAALYSTVNHEFFLPSEIGSDMSNIVSITSADGETVYYENGLWESNFALTGEQIKANEFTTTDIKVDDGTITYYTSVKSYAGVIDELSDFPAFFNNTAVASEFDAATYPAVAPNVYGYYIVTKNLGSLTDELALTQTEATDYNAANGFNGVLDGQGHKLQFKLTSGGLVGMILGNATIKNIAIRYEDGTYDSSTKKGGYGVFGYLTNGTPTIANSYIERTNNLYHQGSVFGIMSRPNAKLILTNTAVHANNTSNTSGWYSNMWISSASTNAYLIYAREAATGWPNVTNFTEVVTGNTLTSDLSSFDTNYWTTTDNQLSWKGNNDNQAVVSVGTVTVQPKNLAENGTTQYAIVLPTGADATLTTAKDELVTLFAEATGATLSVVDDGSYDTFGAYISIGNTQTFANANVTMGTLNSQGYHLQTVNNTIFINANSSVGCLYGVYGLMNELFGFKQYSEDTYTLDNATAATVELPSLNKTENPDFEMRMPSNGALLGDAAYRNRMNMANVETDFFFAVGDYVNNAKESANTGWRIWHNALEILPYAYWTGQGKTNWFSDNTVNGSVNQLCYTAHGNTDDYNAMVEQIVNVMAITLTSSQITNRPNAIYLPLTSEDGEGVCTCDACTTAKTTYGSNSGAVIKLCNDVSDGVVAWMEANPTYKRDNVKVIFYAYNDYVTAPTAGTIEMNENVAVMYAISDYVNYYYDINNAENDDFKAQLDAWAALADVNGSDLCVWTYTKNFSMYMLRADVYGADAFFNENAYRYFANKGVDLWFNQGATNGTATLSAFEKLNGYIDAQMMWDNTQDVATLTSEWFTAMYGEGASYMTSLYEDQNAKACSLFGMKKDGIPSVAMEKASARNVLTNDVLTTWFGYIDSAKSAVNADTTLTDSEKAKMIAHINEEWISIEFLYVYLYYQNTVFDSADGVDLEAAAEQEKFRAVLGYDSTTGTYATDVVLLEKAGSTLVEWIESSFTSTV